MECPVNCINWITAKIYAEIFAESLQVLNIEERIDLLSVHCHSYVLSVKAKIYSEFSAIFSISLWFAGRFNFWLSLELCWEKNAVHNIWQLVLSHLWVRDTVKA